ncbi:hypothetical protein [Pseudoclavibacter helvolus]|uniref:hypothetical protein n=1 Tax=Pseudoclavibacter helvolus TaxID=255205 RepID=UPI003C793EDA
MLVESMFFDSVDSDASVAVAATDLAAVALLFVAVADELAVLVAGDFLAVVFAAPAFAALAGVFVPVAPVVPVALVAPVALLSVARALVVFARVAGAATGFVSDAAAVLRGFAAGAASVAASSFDLALVLTDAVVG